MPEYYYSARDTAGQFVSGRRQAETEQALAAMLQQESLIPIEISQAKTKASASLPSFSIKLPQFRRHRVSQDELQMFCRQMYTLVKAGIPLATAITRLSETTRDPVFAETLRGILAGLNQGQSLYQALGQHPDIFSNFFVNLVKVGETTGRLEEVFLHLSEYIELEADTKKKIKTALRYPLMVLIATLVALLVINAFVIPAFANMFKTFKGTLPLPTRILIETSNFIVNYWYLILGLTIFGVMSIHYYVTKTKVGERRWAKLQLRLPIIGSLIHRIILARFTRLFALVLRAGLTAVEGIELVGASTGNTYVAEKIHEIAGLVERGNTIATSISKTGLFPPLILQMITLGEETGNVDTMLDDVSEFYQREITYDLVRLSDAIEPIMLVIMGAMVLILALGVFLPMWDMASQLK